jgi:hypothetical protein
MTVDPIEFTLGNIRPDRQLHYENYQLVTAVQALWGAISPNMVAVSLRCVGPEVHMHFYLEVDSLIDREGIEDVATDLEALQFTSVPIHTHVSVVGERISWRDIEGRSIYRRYEGPSVG